MRIGKHYQLQIYEYIIFEANVAMSFYELIENVQHGSEREQNNIINMINMDGKMTWFGSWAQWNEPE